MSARHSEPSDGSQKLSLGGSALSGPRARRLLQGPGQEVNWEKQGSIAKHRIAKHGKKLVFVRQCSLVLQAPLPGCLPGHQRFHGPVRDQPPCQKGKMRRFVGFAFGDL